MTAVAETLGVGYVIKLIEVHRYMVDLYNDGMAHPGLGIVSFQILGKGNIAGSPLPYPPRSIQQFESAFVSAAIDDDDNDDVDTENVSSRLEGWDYERHEPPPVPPVCAAPGRECSVGGINFFGRCICEECPVSSKNLQELRKLYFGANKEVEEMTESHIRNMLYWSYATDTYGWHGWKNRQELPSCLLFMIRKAYPNPKGTPYVEFKTADNY